MSRKRLDQILVERNVAESREQAQRLIRAGQVKVGGTVAAKPGHLFPADAEIDVEEGERYVSRGGYKLEAAVSAFGINPSGRVCLDVGASTGGFTDCLLQHGAVRVYAVDVGKGQLHWKLRNDPRVTVLEKVNARYLSPELFADRPSLAVVDVSFISLTLVLPAVTAVLTPEAEVVTLIKPQFEAGPEQVGKGGIVRDASVHEEVVGRVRTFGVDRLGLAWVDVIPRPVKGPSGNVEFLAYWRKTAPP